MQMYDIEILDHRLDAGCIWMRFTKLLQDGSVNIPEVLQPYMMGMKVLLGWKIPRSSDLLNRDDWKQPTHIFAGGLVYGPGKEPPF